MPRRFDRVILITLPLTPILLLIAVGAFFLIARSGEAYQPSPGLTAEATMESPSGTPLGTVQFLQSTTGVLVMAELNSLPPGGHAFVIHEVGSCRPDFSAAGDHFNPEDVQHGFIHPGWKRGEAIGGHGGDLPNIYAASDGFARADFLTAGFTLDIGPRHSVFDADGSAVIVH